MDVDQIESTKALKIEAGISVRQQSPDTSRPAHDVRASMPANTSGLFASGVPPTSNEQWKAGPGLDGYVQNQRESLRNSLPQVTSPVWTSFPLDNGLNPVSPSYMEGDSHAPVDGYPCSNPVDLPQDGYPFPFESSLDFSWTNTNGHHGETGPT
jgi:hypothetical protein